jgi:hypothetical protein
VQTNDENFEVTTQTEDIQYSTRWTQYPPDDSKGYGEGNLFIFILLCLFYDHLLSILILR